MRISPQPLLIFSLACLEFLAGQTALSQVQDHVVCQYSRFHPIMVLSSTQTMYQTPQGRPLMPPLIVCRWRVNCNNPGSVRAISSFSGVECSNSSACTLPTDLMMSSAILLTGVESVPANGTEEEQCRAFVEPVNPVQQALMCKALEATDASTFHLNDVACVPVGMAPPSPMPPPAPMLSPTPP